MTPTKRSTTSPRASSTHGVMRSTGSIDTQAVFDIDETDLAPPHLSEVTYFGTDFDVHGLVRRLAQGDILIPTFDPEFNVPSRLSGFQRGLVWTKPQMDRFVESLLLGFPVPGIFLVQEPDNSLLVLDGQQRIRTLQSFYRGMLRDKRFTLETVDDKFLGQSYETLGDDQRRSLDNTFIHATVVRYDPERDSEAVYQIFERLNTGGTNLQPHEIRVALFHGEFVDLLRKLNDDESWRELYGKRSIRLKDQELILRFFALLQDADSYERPLKSFLNDYLETNRHLKGWSKNEKYEIFPQTVQAILSTIGVRAFKLKSQVNAALCDAVLVGYAQRLERGPIKDARSARRAYSNLIEDADFTNAISRATADEDSVRLRLARAGEAFAKVR